MVQAQAPPPPPAPAKAVDLTEATLILPRKSVEDLIADARVKLGMDVRNHFNFAVVGRSGVGKSTLINAYRRLKDNHSEAARVGETETTTQITRYADPLNPHIMLWDLPGAGTLRQPEATYFEDNMLYAFDCILVLSADRFMKLDYDIANKAVQYKRACAFVRTKADQSLKSIAEREAKTMQDASKDLRRIVQESFQTGLKDAGFSLGTSFQLFVVSGWAFTKRTAYTLHDAETGEADTSLQKMDEDQLVEFVTNSVKSRFP